MISDFTPSTVGATYIPIFHPACPFGVSSAPFVRLTILKHGGDAVARVLGAWWMLQQPLGIFSVWAYTIPACASHTITSCPQPRRPMTMSETKHVSAPTPLISMPCAKVAHPQVETASSVEGTVARQYQQKPYLPPNQRSCGSPRQPKRSQTAACNANALAGTAPSTAPRGSHRR